MCLSNLKVVKQPNPFLDGTIHMASSVHNPAMHEFPYSMGGQQSQWKIFLLNKIKSTTLIIEYDDGSFLTFDDHGSRGYCCLTVGRPDVQANMRSKWPAAPQASDGLNLWGFCLRRGSAFLMLLLPPHSTAPLDLELASFSLNSRSPAALIWNFLLLWLLRNVRRQAASWTVLCHSFIFHARVTTARWSLAVYHWWLRLHDSHPCGNCFYYACVWVKGKR